MMGIGEKLAFARELKGWTLRELEARAGVSNALISQIETGKVKDPGFFTVVKLCWALGLPVERMASDEVRRLEMLTHVRARKAATTKVQP